MGRGDGGRVDPAGRIVTGAVRRRHVAGGLALVAGVWALAAVVLAGGLTMGVGGADGPGAIDLGPGVAVLIWAGPALILAGAALTSWRSRVASAILVLALLPVAATFGATAPGLGITALCLVAAVLAWTSARRG